MQRMPSHFASRRSLWYYLHTLSAAKKRSCRVLMYGCGIGPINGKSDIEYAAGILNDCVDCITLREEDSRRLLDEIGVTKPEIIISADLAFSLTPAPDGEVDEFMQGWRRKGSTPASACVRGRISTVSSTCSPTLCAIPMRRWG